MAFIVFETRDSLFVLIFFLYTLKFVLEFSNAEWFLTFYDEYLNISCLLSERIVIHCALFGHFGHQVTNRGVVQKCSFDNASECWIDVTASVSMRCSGHSFCQTHVLYSVDFPHKSFAVNCSAYSSSKPTLFVEYDCVSKTLFTELSGSSHADPEQVGGYLTTLDYTYALNGGTEWRSQLAEAVCRPNAERLPFRFNLSAPTIHGSLGYNHEESVSFILRIKDFGLTQPPKISGVHESNDPSLRLAGDFHCPGPGLPCQQDYLEILAKLSNDGILNRHGSSLLLPVARFCLVTGSNDVLTSQTESGLIGRKFGPLPVSSELQFTSNLNLLNPHATPGKGILIEYIALFCSPITAPSGFGIVDYRFQFSTHPSHTVAYAEVFCPSDRWLEPKQPKGGQLTFDQEPWWLERQQNTTLICDHHTRTWSPDRIPEACLTESELQAFVAKLHLELESVITTTTTSEAYLSPNTSSKFPPISNTTDPSSIDENAAQLSPLPSERNALVSPISDNGSNVVISIAIGVVFAVVICLLAVLLAVYCLRYRLVTKYQKPDGCPSIPEPMMRSSTSFNPSMPSIYPSTIYSMDWRKKWSSRNKWDLLKPWRHRHWSQNLSGTYPDLPRRTLLHGSASAVSRTPETVILDRPSPHWRYQMQRSDASSYSLAHGYHGHPGIDISAGASPSPWLRTNSTTRLGPQKHFFASSAELMSPVDGLSQMPRSWWLPWRRSIRKQRRLYNHLQRRKEAQYLSQRRLLDSSGMSNSSSFHMGLSPSTTLGLTSSTQLKMFSNEHSNSQSPHIAYEVKRLPERPLSQNAIMATVGGVGCTVESGNSFGTSTIPRFSENSQFAYSNVDPATGYPLANPPALLQLTSAGNTLVTGTNETLPSKITPSGNSISEGFKRISSFLRTLNDSLTPPRSAKQIRRWSARLEPRAMSSTIHTRTHLSDRTNGAGPPLSRLSEFHVAKPQRSKSESGSVRFQRHGFLRSLFNLSGSKEDQSPSVYNLIGDDSSMIGDPNSCSVATGISRIDSNGHGSPGIPYSGPDYWTHCHPSESRGSDACTLRAQSTKTCVAHAQTTDSVDLPEANNPYLIPSSVKRQRRESARSRIPNKVAVCNSDSDHLASGTSSAISSLVFADSAEDEQEVGSPMEACSAPPFGKSHASMSMASNHLSALDYFTYDQTHTIGGTADSKPNSPLGELFSTQVVAIPGLGSRSQWPLRQRNNIRNGDSNSRPLSDAMISNHYYDGNDMQLGFPVYPEPSSPPPSLPPRGTTQPNSFTGLKGPAFKIHPVLPPLWALPRAISRHQGVDVNVTPNQSVYESADSLYETVDNVRPTEQQPDQKTATSSNGVDGDKMRTRQKLALPPTPVSRRPAPAPVATIDDDTDDM